MGSVHVPHCFLIAVYIIYLTQSVTLAYFIAPQAPSHPGCVSLVASSIRTHLTKYSSIVHTFHIQVVYREPYNLVLLTIFNIFGYCSVSFSPRCIRLHTTL